MITFEDGDVILNGCCMGTTLMGANTCMSVFVDGYCHAVFISSKVGGRSGEGVCKAHIIMEIFSLM